MENVIQLKGRDGTKLIYAENHFGVD